MSRRMILPLGCYVMLSLGVTLSSGCNLIAYPLYMAKSEQTKKVPAEYGQLGDKTVCIWVWAEDAIVFDFPQIPLEVADYAKHYMAKNIKAKFVDPLAVDRFRRQEYDAASLSPVEVGRRFEADVVLFIQVLEFRTRPANSPNLLQGYISASCWLYDCTGQKALYSPDRVLWSGQVETSYPTRGPVSMMQANDVSIRAQVLGLFAQELARKFYQYRVKLHPS